MAIQTNRIASGDYETSDGIVRVYKLVDVSPPAWNVEVLDASDIYRIVVDGAATKQDALELLAEWQNKALRFAASWGVS